MDIFAMDISALEAAGAGACAIVAAIYAAYLKGKQSGTTQTAPVAVPTAHPVQSSGAPLNVPETNIYDPAKHGGKGPAFIPWEQMRQWVAFKTSATTKQFILSGIVDSADRVTITNAIAAAEAENQYDYTIRYSKGYFRMKAVCEPIGTNEYKYQVIIAGSGSDKQ